MLCLYTEEKTEKKHVSGWTAPLIKHKSSIVIMSDNIKCKNVS